MLWGSGTRNIEEKNKNSRHKADERPIHIEDSVM